MRNTNHKIILIIIIMLFIAIIPNFSKAAKVYVGTVKNVKVSERNTDYLKLTWKGVSKATGYKVYLYNSSKNKYETVGNTKNKTYTLKKLVSSKKYKIKIRAYKTINNKKYFGSYSEVITTATKPTQVAKLKIDSQTDSKIDLSWDKVARATGYKVCIYNENTKQYEEKAISTKNSITISNLLQAKTYKIKVRAYKTVNNKEYYGRYSEIIDTFTKPSKITNFQAKSTSIDSITLTWTKLPRVLAYRVYQYNSSTKKYEKIGEVSQNEFVVSKLDPATGYNFKVRAYIQYNGTKYFGSYSNILEASTSPHKITDLKVSSVGQNYIEVKWSKVSQANGYAIYIFSQSSQSFKQYKKTKSNSMKITDLDAARFYKMYVKAYITMNDKNYYSAASNTISQKTNSTQTELAGIDVSVHNGNIDWKKVKKAGVDFAILRCGFGQDYTSQDDTRFAQNVKACEDLGIPYGVYLYSYALNTSNAKSEADHALRLLKGHTPKYGVWFDMEDADGYKKKHGMPSNKDLVNICATFCDKLIKKGYKTGIYASLSWFKNQLNDTKLDKYEKWVAQWYDKCSYTKDYVMWQYTSSGMVDGINGNVDMNIMYLKKS